MRKNNEAWKTLNQKEWEELKGNNQQKYINGMETIIKLSSIAIAVLFAFLILSFLPLLTRNYNCEPRRSSHIVIDSKRVGGDVKYATDANRWITIPHSVEQYKRGDLILIYEGCGNNTAEYLRTININ